MKRIVILISARGSNMQAIIEANLPVEIAAVISSHPTATGLEIARAHQIPAISVDYRHYPERALFDKALAEQIDEYSPDLIVLAGFMRILTATFVERYPHRLINIHPSLLPAFPGLDTHLRAIQEGVKIHGCTVHFVTAKVDYGPIIAQAAVPILPLDTPESLAVRVLKQEHRLYPQVVRWFAENRVSFATDGKVIVESQQRNEEALISPTILT